MGCGNCGSKGTPNGCKSNGSCGTNSCNRLNAYDWLVNLPIVDNDSYCRVVEVTFNSGARKEFYRNSTLQYFSSGEIVAVEGVSGFDVGEISLTGETVRLQLKKKGVKESASDMKRILRRATERDVEQLNTNKARERDALVRTRAIVRQLKLNMKVSEVEIQADGKKATFFYIADDRVDFRELIKILAGEFKVKVEMRQIGARQEAGKVGGIGSCGRELCCATWLTEFKSVNTAAARYQNLSINQTKLSGQCGRLKCCLNYELDTYLDALQGFPEHADMLRIARGTATLIKKDIFKNLMWYVLPDSSKQYPLTIERVKEIKALNTQGVIPEELGTVEVVSSKAKEVEPEFVDVVGHITLRSLEKADRKRRDQRRQQPPGGRSGQKGAGDAQGKSNLPVPAPRRSAGQSGQQGQPGQQPKGQQGGSRRGGNQPKPEGQQQEPKAQQGGQQQAPKQPREPRPPREPRNQQGGNQQGGGQQEGGQQQGPREPRNQQGQQPKAQGGGRRERGGGGGQQQGQKPEGGQQQQPKQGGENLPRSQGSRRRREGGSDAQDGTPKAEG
jgi:cell fate regulator YaaT (PSP1 superfamily)